MTDQPRCGHDGLCDVRDPRCVSYRPHRVAPLDGTGDGFRCSCGAEFDSAAGWAVCPVELAAAEPADTVLARLLAWARRTLPLAAARDMLTLDTLMRGREPYPLAWAERSMQDVTLPESRARQMQRRYHTRVRGPAGDVCQLDGQPWPCHAIAEVERIEHDAIAADWLRGHAEVLASAARIAAANFTTGSPGRAQFETAAGWLETEYPQAEEGR